MQMLQDKRDRLRNVRTGVLFHSLGKQQTSILPAFKPLILAEAGHILEL